MSCMTESIRTRGDDHRSREDALEWLAGRVRWERLLHELRDLTERHTAGRPDVDRHHDHDDHDRDRDRDHDGRDRDRSHHRAA